jgi:hypothetical protein
LSRPRDNHCEEALQVMSEVRTELDVNPEAYTDGRQTIISIVQAGESICDSLAEGEVPGLSVPTETGDVMTDVTATPTP